MQKEAISFPEQSLKLKIENVSYHTSVFWRGMHLHDAVEIVFVKKGTLWVHFLHEKEVLSSGQILLINSNVVHCLKNADSAEITYAQAEIHIPEAEEKDSELLSRFLSHQSLRPYCIAEQDSELYRIFSSIRRETEQKDAFFKMYVQSYIRLLISFMLRHHLIAAPMPDPHVMPSCIIPVVRYIEQNYMQPILLEELSLLAGYNKFELCRKFKKFTGKTIVNYINFVRIHHAKLFLRDNKTITEAAFQCGFSSVQYFNRTFKQYIGLSPGEWKRQRYKNSFYSEDDESPASI